MLGQKAKIKKTISSFDGTLYKDDIVKIDRAENDDYRVIDPSGKIWYVKKNQVELLPEEKA